MRMHAMNPLSALAVTLLVMACGSAADDRGLCTAFGPDPSGYEGCNNAVLNLAVHPCQAEVRTKCGVATGPAATGSACAADTMAACATDYYLRNYAPESLPSCDPNRPILPIDKQLLLALYRYSNIADSAVVRHTEGLQRYYEPHELTMTTQDIAEPDPVRYAISGTEAELSQALIDVGISPDATTLTPEQDTLAQQAIGNVMFASTKAFFARHALPAEKKVNVVIIDQIVSPEMVRLMDISGTIVGLGLSSSLLAHINAEGDTSASLNTMLQINSDFTPTLFVGHSDIARLTGNYDLVVAHEMGHALGLPHVDTDGNLMQQGGSLTCRHWLSQAQIDMMGPFADAWLSPDDALSQILDARRTVLRKLLQRRQPAPVAP